MKTVSIQLGKGQALVNLNEQEYQELENILENEPTPVDPERLGDLVLKAIKKFQPQLGTTEQPLQQETTKDI